MLSISALSRSIVGALFLAFAIPATGAPPHPAYRIDDAQSDVDAKVGFLGIGSRTAHFPSVTGTASLASETAAAIELEVAIDARQLSASDALTTSRLRGKDFFDVEHYPLVRFHGERLEMTGATTGTITGKLTARGVTKPVTLAVSFSSPPGQAAGAASIDLEGTTTIDRRDFGMTAYSLIVGRKVRITLDARLVPV